MIVLFDFIKSYFNEVEARNDESRAERMIKIQKEYEIARTQLLMAHARGVLITWRNDFGYLQRMLVKAGTGRNIEQMHLIIGEASQKCILDITSYHNAIGDQALALIVRDLEQDICQKIYAIAKQYAADVFSIDEALRIVARNNALSLIYDYLMFRINKIEESSHCHQWQ